MSIIVYHASMSEEFAMQQELEVMGKIAALLSPLDADARLRVLDWVIKAMDVQQDVRQVSEAKGVPPTSSPVATMKYATFAELFHAASPRVEKEKALVAAYWIQHSSGVDQFVSQQLNTELKHIGYGVTNITDTLYQLISERPNLIIQLSKSGSSQQARKTYKITDAGIRRVSEMLSANSGVST